MNADRMMMCFVVILLVLPTALALTVSPAKYEIEHKEGESTYMLTVRNDEPRTLFVSFTKTGPFSEDITVNPTMTLAPGEAKTVQVVVDLPASSQPGIVESGILVEARPTGSDTVSAASALLHIIRVRTPSEGKFVSGRILQSATRLDEETLTTVSVTNIGTQRIQDLHANITIAGAGEFSFLTPSVSLEPSQTKDLVVAWVPQVPGSYDVAAKLFYDEKTTLLTSGMVIGNLSAELVRVDIGEFRLGDPFRVTTYVRNQWGDILPVVASVHIVQNNQTIQEGRSTSVILDPLQEKGISVFVESGNVHVGAAELVATVSFGGESLEERIPVIVGVDSLSKKTAIGGVTRTGMVIVIILGLTLVGVLLTVFIRHRRANNG